MEDEFTGAIIFCPVCVSQSDAEGWGHQEVECSACGTKFTVELDEEKVAAHALHG